MAGPVDPRFERSVRRWLAGYPRRWRLARADEVIGTLAEMAPPGATRLDVRSGVGLLVNGVRTRRRMLPPLRVRMRYRFGLGGVPRQYRGWLADEIASPMFQWRVMLLVIAPQLAIVVFRRWSGSVGAGELVWWTTWTVLMLAMPRTRAQRDAAARHLVTRPGEQPTPWDVQSTAVLRDRLTARWLVPLALAAAVVVAFSGAVAVLAGSRWSTPLGACLGVGVLAAVRLAVRARARLPRRVPQPARRVVAFSRRMVVTLGCLVVFAALMAMDDALGPGGSAAGTAPIVLGFALLLLPAFAVGAVLAVRGPADLAAADVRWLALGWGPVPADRLARGVVPVWAMPDPSLAPVPAPPAPVDPATA